MKRSTPYCAHRGKRGSVAIEFALVLPLLVSLVFGIVEVGLMLYNYAMLTNASRVGVRAVIAGKSNATDMVKDYCQNNLLSIGSAEKSVKDGDIAIVSDVAIPGSAKPGARVSVSYAHKFLFGPLFGITNAVKTLTASTVMRME